MVTISGLYHAQQNTDEEWEQGYVWCDGRFAAKTIGVPGLSRKQHLIVLRVKLAVAYPRSCLKIVAFRHTHR